MLHNFFTEFKTVSIIVIIIITTISIAVLFNLSFSKHIKKSLVKHGRDLTTYLFLKNITIVLIYVIGFAAALIQITELKIVGHSLLAGAGVISLIAGLASQQALSNIMSGILIVIFKPFRLNDRITFRGSFTGIVEDINLRQVVLRDLENNRIIIPNSVISSDLIVNSHLNDTNICKIIDIGIGYSSNIDLALEIMKEEVANHPMLIDILTPEDINNKVPLVIARVVELGESSVILRVWAWAKDAMTGLL
ncbi:MAG: mechanosensitive ion channel family protein [Thermodesulfobacteriota bacterium]